MRITADTNVLVRAIVGDDPDQAPAATALLASATTIAVPVPVLCELVWGLRASYSLSNAEIAGALRQVRRTKGIVTDFDAVDAGLSTLEAGGDFADGVIAHVGRVSGGRVFASFDRRAVNRVVATGHEAADPADLVRES